MGTNWNFHPPNAPHANRAIEIMVKMVKKALFVTTHDSVLSFTELQTVCFVAAEIVNERPLAIHHTRGNEDLNLNNLCPRASAYTPSSSWQSVSNVTRRAKYVHEISERFWKQWYKLVFPSVVIRPKWHVQGRNLRVDDIVMIADNNALRRNYRLARVSEVYPDSKGRIRQVQVSYKLDTAKAYTSVKR